MSQHTNIIVAPSGKYAFGQPTTRLSWERGAAVVQVIEIISTPKGVVFSPTPARYNVETIADRVEGTSLAIDYGQGWALNVEDTDAFIDYARGVMNSLLANA